MIRVCPSCLGAICDFCAWYRFDGGDDRDGAGYCLLRKARRRPDDSCASFRCHRLGDHDAPAAESPKEI